MPSRTITVTLNDAPSDVLRWLVDTPGGGTREQIAAAMETLVAEDVSPRDVLVSTSRALRLLHELGFVLTYGNEVDGITWRATDAGIAAVRVAPSLDRDEAQR